MAFPKLKFREALRWLRGRVEMTKDAWEQLSAFARRRAFTVAAVAQADVIHDVRTAIDRAVDDGETLDDFKQRIGGQLLDAWGGSVADPGWRIETIFRTNVQSAYAAGRHRQATAPDTLATRPFWMFDAILDSRTSPICEACDGVVRPADDPWWRTHSPPLHHNCRSQFITLTREQAEDMGVTSKSDIPRGSAAKGFGEPLDEWEPDVSKYPPDLAHALEKKLQESR